jgi:hypothetical protein
MEDNCEILASPLSLKREWTNILFPIESAALQQEEVLCLKNMKQAFENPNLIIGLINEDPSVEEDSLTPVVEDLGKIECVDQVLILKSRPTLEDFRSMNLDMIATFEPDNYKDFDKVIHLKNFERNEDKDEVVIETEGVELNDLKVRRITKFQAITASCKKRLKNIKTSVCKSPFSTTTFENALNRSRFYLQKTFQEWGERRERILRRWITRAGTTTSLLVKMLREVWENA